MEIGWGSVAWINLAQDRDKWRSLETMVMNVYVPEVEWLHNWQPLNKGSAPRS
jgi:hypothetical protein